LSATRGEFSSRLGFILAAAGSAVGLGNIWGFPTQAGGPSVPRHHSPLFKISPEPAVRAGVESTVVALMTLLQD